MDQPEAYIPQILYSCYYENSRSGEHFVSEHVLSYQVAGSLVHTDGKNEYRVGPGGMRLVTRNQLIKAQKIPPADGPFKSLSVYLDQVVLKEFSTEHHVISKQQAIRPAAVVIDGNPLLSTFFESLRIYAENEGFTNPDLIKIKQREAIVLLLQADPSLKDLLFDFSQPHKIDLEEFMNKNYQFNVRMDRFATLTGRSLATFKRDFEKQFGMTPGKWLQNKRLHEAYHQLRELGKTPSEVYWDVGFEDLSHFSFAFKKKFGVAPTGVGK